MTLYVFITHQKNFNNCYQRISDMMVDDFIVVQGGFLEDSYDEDKKVLNINCNDGYVGLPEKVMKTFHFLIRDERFSEYTHFCKMDDDMKVVKRFGTIDQDYIGMVSRGDGNRHWHIGRCGNYMDQVPYLGGYVPWCLGGCGYVVARNALNKIVPNHNYLDHIYEDLYLATELKRVGIDPIQINTKEYLVSPDH